MCIRDRGFIGQECASRYHRNLAQHRFFAECGHIHMFRQRTPNKQPAFHRPVSNLGQQITIQRFHCQRSLFAVNLLQAFQIDVYKRQVIPPCITITITIIILDIRTVPTAVLKCRRRIINRMLWTLKPGLLFFMILKADRQFYPCLLYTSRCV